MFGEQIGLLRKDLSKQQGDELACQRSEDSRATVPQDSPVSKKGMFD